MTRDKVLIHETYRQGNDHRSVTHVRDSLSYDDIRGMFGPSVGERYIRELAQALRDTGRGQLGWSDYRVTTLSDLMAFDHVISVHVDGTITEPNRVQDVPEAVYDDELSAPEGWELLTGYTGQYSYNGPTMHASEYIGGGLARDILATPGYYVALVSYVLTEEDDDSDDVAGWCVAHRPL
jgi:hypothetical protein